MHVCQWFVNVYCLILASCLFCMLGRVSCFIISSNVFDLLLHVLFTISQIIICFSLFVLIFIAWYILLNSSYCLRRWEIYSRVGCYCRGQRQLGCIYPLCFVFCEANGEFANRFAWSNGHANLAFPKICYWIFNIGSWYYHSCILNRPCCSAIFLIAWTIL